MIGELPKKLDVNGIEYEIRTDYRDCLRILEAFQDPDLSGEEKTYVMLFILYKEFEKIPKQDIKEAVEQAVWFLNCGNSIQGKKTGKPVYNWKQDEQIIFSAVNKVAGREIRGKRYLHFWTFISYFYEIGEGVFSVVVGIRSKKNKNKKLDKQEAVFYRENKELVDLKVQRTKEEQEEIDRLNQILG